MLMEFAKHVARGAMRRTGYALTRIDKTGQAELPPDFDDATSRLCRLVRPYTMTSPERIFALRKSVEYVVQFGIEGDIVECGVWKGGSMMAVAQTLLELHATDRNLYLFDTFEGMPPPTSADVNFKGKHAADLLSVSKKESSDIWACGALDEVKRTLMTTEYPPERITFVKGQVEQTIPNSAPNRISILRLDTDWYESTSHELLHLYPRLSPGGVLIIDDYGHWAGARQAVDEYIAKHGLRVFLNRIDYTGRICIKPPDLQPI